MICPGEIRCYVGGRYELCLVPSPAAKPEEVLERDTDEIFTMVWVPGVMVCKARYSNKGVRDKIIEKMIETWKDIEIAILPDDIDYTKNTIEQEEADIKI